MARVPLYPFLYTRGSGGMRAGAGFQYMRWCVEVPAQLFAAGEPACVYHRPSELASEEDPARLPQSLWRISLSQGWSMFGRSRYAARQMDSRGGNCAVGGYFYRDEDLRPFGWDIFALLRAGLPLPQEGDLDLGAGALRPIEVDLAGAAPSEPWLRQQVASLGLGPALAFALTAAADFASGRPLLVGLPDWERQEALFEVLLAFLPPGVRRVLGFTTYTRDVVGQFSLQGRFGRALGELAAAVTRQSQWVLVGDGARLHTSTRPAPVPGPVQAIVEAWSRVGWRGVEEVHLRLDPLGEHLYGSEELAAAICDLALTPVEALRRLAEVSSDHPAMGAAAESITLRGIDWLVSGEADARECVLFALFVAEIAEFLPPALRGRAVETSYERLPRGLPATFWAGLLRAEILAAHPHPAQLRGGATRRIREDASGEGDWAKVLAELEGHVLEGEMDRGGFVELVAAILDRAAGARNDALWSAAAGALSLALPPRRDDELLLWAPRLRRLASCLEAPESQTRLHRLMLASWLVCMAGGALQRDLPPEVFERLPGQALGAEGGAEWLSEVAARIGPHLTRHVLLPLFLNRPDLPARSQLRVRAALVALRRGAGLADQDQYILAHMADRGWVDAVLEELVAQRDPPRIEDCCRALLRCGSPALAERDQSLRVFFRQQAEADPTRAVARFRPGWAVLAADGGKPASNISRWLLEAVFQHELAGVELLALWEGVGPDLRRLHEGHHHDEAAWIVGALDALEGVRRGRGKHDYSWPYESSLAAHAVWALGSPGPLGRGFLVALARVIAPTRREKALYAMLEDIERLAGPALTAQLLPELLAGTLLPRDVRGNTERCGRLLAWLLGRGSIRFAPLVAGAIAGITEPGGGREGPPLKASAVAKYLRRWQQDQGRRRVGADPQIERAIAAIEVRLGVGEGWF
ncbi:MAG: hypothetical protein ABIO70_28865 [Pseudomonadota bacterium]